MQSSRFSLQKDTGYSPDAHYAKIEPAYSYNWPYDFYSLVELGKIEAEVTINKISEPDNCTDRET